MIRHSIYYNEASRLDWVDISKGIAISLMVAGHSGIPISVSRWIWTFHMPFFFIIAALLTNWTKYPMKLFVKRKFNHLFYPFLAYSICNLFLIPYCKGVDHLTYLEQVLSMGWGGVALWFVGVFFLAQMLSRLVSERFVLLGSLTGLLSGYILCYFDIQLSWNLHSVPFAVALMLIGRKFQKQVVSYIMHISTPHAVAVMSVGLLISIAVSRIARLDMAPNHILPIIPICIGIIGGCSALIMISVLISRHSAILCLVCKHIGQNTFIIMGLSQVTIMMINTILHVHFAVKYFLLVAILAGLVVLKRSIKDAVSGLFSTIQ